MRILLEEIVAAITILAFVFAFGCILFAKLHQWSYYWYHHFRTRDTPPQAEQFWRGPRVCARVRSVGETHVCLSQYQKGRMDQRVYVANEEWYGYVRKNRIHLVRG